jgi:hypothetical protein
VFENVVLIRFFEYKREGVTGSLRKCLNKELHKMRPTSDFIWQMKSKKMRWVRHAACMENIISA